MQILNIREGQLIGRDHIFTDDVLEESEQDILTAFAAPYYVNRAFIPSRSSLTNGLEEREIEPIRQWLSELREGKVTLTFPQRGAETRL